MDSIGLICAIPQESGPVVRLFPETTPIPLAGFPSWALLAGEKRVTLVESGMGAANAAAATNALIASARPDIILSIGFCGAVSTGIQIGDLVVARQQYSFSRDILTAEHDPDSALTELLLRALAAAPCRAGSFITTDGFANKKMLSARIPARIPLPVLEMESATIARTCRQAGIRVAALRAVSDTSDEDPSAIVAPLFAPDFTMSRIRAALTLLRRPWLLPPLARLAGNAKRAGDSLAEALAHTLERLE